jgi:hypothetical protein
MRSTLSFLCALLLFPIATSPQAGHAKPPGITTADTLSNQPLEPPAKPGPRQINIDQVNSETQELRRLSDGLPAQMDQVTKGQLLPKDLSDNLKRIEKLAKQLRSQIIP